MSYYSPKRATEFAAEAHEVSVKVRVSVRVRVRVRVGVSVRHHRLLHSVQRGAVGVCLACTPRRLARALRSAAHLMLGLGLG